MSKSNGPVMPRRVEPEWLDELPPQDARATASRKDLQRINSIMGHVSLLARLLQNAIAGEGIRRIVELGAGDGTFLLRLARRLSAHGRPLQVVLVDRQEIVTSKTLESFRNLGWGVEVVVADVFAWLDTPLLPDNTCIIANLFLHHFHEDQLRQLFGQASLGSRLFAACEPRRSWLALGASRMLGAIGCNAVTRHDAVISVRAGFVDGELSACWPENRRWKLIEQKAGLFSHCFVAGQGAPSGNSQ